MSFTDDFMSELDKKKKKKKKNSSSTSGTSATGGKSYSEKFMDALGDDISPMPSPTMASIHKYGEDDIAPVKGGDKDSWFKSGGFSDGVDSVGDFFGDLGQTVLGTAGDLAWDVAKGAGRMVEGLVDLGTYGVASVADKLGADEFSEKARDVAKYSATDEWTKDITDFVDRYSVLGNKADMIGEGLGQVGTIILTGGVAASAGLGAGGVAAVTTGATGLSSMGTGIGEAYNSGATDEEAFWYGLGSGAIEAGTELLFGGLGKSVQALGISRGIGGLDEIFAKKLSSKIAGSIANESVQKLLGNTIEFGVKSAGEGLEEVLSGFGSAVMKKLTYMEDEELSKLVKDENLLEQFVVGTITSSIVQGGDFVKATKSGTDFVTGHTAADEKVINKVVEEEVAKREAAGEKLTTKDKNKIYDSVVDLMEKGQIDIDTIESVLGGDTYKAYKETVDSEDALKNELAELRKMKSGDMNDLQTSRMNELKEMNLDDTTKRDGLRKNLDDMLSPMLNGSKLSESYRERERRGQAFEDDLSKYTGKQREAVERAVKSGVLNNTYRSHELVNVLSKIEADKGITFDYTNNAKLKESGFALEGVTVNGFASKSKGAVTLNVQSAKAWESVVGHEITHVLEGTEAYSELRNALYAYAESKGELEGRRAYLNELYQNMDADVEAELTADLVGDYLFTDKDFVSKLTGNRTLFQKIYDEIKYLWNVATGKEKTEIEKVKAEFDRVWKEYSNNNETIEESSESREYGDADVQYSIREEAPPKETGIAYKVFFVKDGKLYPPMVANPDGADTPMGVWLNADVGTAAPPSKTGRAQVKAGGKGTQGGSGSLAFRPGWHLGDLPRASQFDRVNPETGKKELFPENFVWAEVEYAKDVDYQEEAMSYGYTDNGKFRHAYAGLPRLPENGYYRYRTNPKPDTVPWVITGAMKVNRLLSDAEVNEILEKNGVPAVHRKGGDVGLDKFGFDEKGQVQYSISTADKAFEDALFNGETETAQKMLDAAAKKAGYKKAVYHGTSADFTVFDTDEDSTSREVHAWSADYPDGTIFVAEDESVAYHYGNKVMPLYLDTRGMKTFVHKDMPAHRAMDDIHGYEVYNYPVIAVKGNDMTIYATLDNTRLKSAELVTTDDDGVIIPLSQRFNAENEDIRFSLSSDSEGKTLYTGSPNTNIQQFKVGGVDGSKRSGDRYGRGVYLTTNENTAKGYAGDSGKVYEINADNLNIFNLNDPITEEMKATLQRELNGKDKQFRNSVLRNFRSEKAFTDFESAEQFFDEQRKLWKEEDGYYAANKPDIKSANDKTGEAVIEYTDFANIDNAIGNLTGNELYDALKSISTDDFASFITGHGFDGISFDEDADNQQYVIYRNEDRLNILNNDIAPTPDVQYSLSPETDADYMSAVERGDTETAQRMVDEAAKAAGYTVRAYHGTRRGDRVGNVFLPERATSGPMAFFTDNKEIAENYAKSKQDTSMAYDPDYDRYETQFRIKTKYSNQDIALYTAWRLLPLDARNRITEKAGQLREDWDGDNELILDPDTNEANGGFQWQLKEARGNAIQALIEQWLNSGNLFNEESRFLDVLEMAGVTEEFKKIGMDSLYFKDPNARHEKVYDTLLKITNPFDTARANEKFADELESWYEEQDQSKYVRETADSDLWDKNNIDAYDFVERVRSDIERGTSHAWTSIPDSVTDYLKHLGYDGIKDVGGKNGGMGHTVWIPFTSEQVKSADPITYDDNGNVIPLSQRFNAENVDIRYSLSKEGEEYAPVGTPLKELALDGDVAPVGENVAPAQKAPSLADIPVLPDKELEDGTYEAIKPSGEMVAEAPLPNEIRPMTEEEANAIQDEKAKADAAVEGLPKSRKQLHKNIINDMKATFSSGGYDLDDVLSKAKDLSTFATVDNTPQRVMEKALGYKEGQVLADLTVNKVAQNETKGIKWLNSFTDRKNGLLAQISNQYRIKPGSKESAAAQMYAEGFYVSDNNDIVAYGDAELAKDFPDASVQNRIKGLASDPRIRQIYDETLEAINKSRARNAYPEIQRLENYFLHFRAMDDTFSKLGIPFNPNDIRAKDLPTDLNGVTADLKPGQPYFASSMHRKGKRTSFDLLGGLERYLTSAKNQIYHIDDIQNLRALRNYIADTYGQANGLEGIDLLSEEEAQDRIEQVYNSHLSTFAKFLNEEANVLAGKTALIDRGLEGIIGRRGMTFLDTVNRQVGSNMVGFNLSSSLTNFIPVAQTFAKTNKFDFLKAFTQTVSNKFGSVFGKSDSFTENSPVIIRRKGADRFYRTPFQKAGDAGYVLMSAVDDISTELIARTKFNELTRKGMDEQTAHFETDKWVSRLMGDRSLGQQPQLYNSKMLGVLTKFQLEVRNQLDSQFYDTIQEAKVSNEHIESALARNAKTAAKVTATFVELAVAQHLFGKAFESVAGYNPAFDIISTLATMFGFDDDDESEDTVLDNIEQGFFELLEDLPYTSTLTGGRIPIANALPVTEFIKGTDSYGNEKSRWETLGEAAPYYILPGGYGQIKKTAAGWNMFSDDHPVTGSYTDSGKLRFPVEDTPLNRVQAAIFGQYASKNAREYFDNGYAPLSEKQIQEYIDVDMPIKDYWEYREGLNDIAPLPGKSSVTLNQKGDYIGGLDLPTSKKNILINNIADRDTLIDMTSYNRYKNFEEFDFAQRFPEKYAVLRDQGISVEDYKKNHEESTFLYTDDYSWAANNPDKYTLSKVISSDVTEYKRYTSDLNKITGENKKEDKRRYIFNLDIDFGAKCVLFKSQYKADDTYNYEIVNYINNLPNLSYTERVSILTELGFRVTADGHIYAD